MNFFIGVVVSLINVLLKMTIAWLAYLLATWLQLPEWGVIGLIVMAVQSTFLTVKTHHG